MTAYGPANETSLEFSGPQFDEADEESTRGVGNKFIRYSLDGTVREGRGGGEEGRRRGELALEESSTLRCQCL